MKTCIECKDKPARYWSSHFCEECFCKLLSEKVKEDNKVKNEINYKRQENGY
jgi:hypothetical protein